jgi:type II secretory pathway pseudopilin PulG
MNAASLQRSGGQAGYNLVMLIIVITLLNVAVAASLPMWSQQIQRDKEEELISRGWQYVEAIRVFQNRFQRLPVRLEELIEVKPRCIRKLWTDPMTDGGKFMPVFQNQPQAPTPQNPDPSGRTGGNPGQGGPGQGGPGMEGPDNPPDGTKPDEVAVGPIIGVRSRSDKKSILVFFGKEKYDEWQFTLESLLGGQRPSGSGQGANPGQPNPPQAGGQPGAGMNLSTRWLGRPLPSIFQPPSGTLPGGEVPGPDGRGPVPRPGGNPRGGPPVGGRGPRSGNDP